MTAGIASLIIRGLSGHHLRGFLPGGDNRAAIARAVSSRHVWTGPGQGWGAVTREGIGLWPEDAGFGNRRPSAAALFVPWAAVLERIARGCADGRRKRYEAAYAAWTADNAAAWKECHQPGQSGPVRWASQAGISQAAAALIRHGCREQLVQGELFSGTEVAA
jgi:hypothetical protein